MPGIRTLLPRCKRGRPCTTLMWLANKILIAAISNPYSLFMAYLHLVGSVFVILASPKTSQRPDTTARPVAANQITALS